MSDETDVTSMREGSKRAYFSGVVDGDGTICISVANAGQPQQSTKPYVAIGCTTRPLCNWAALHFGGSQYRYDRKDQEKPVYFWKQSGATALQKLMSDLQPFLFVKRPQADIMLEYLQLGRKPNSAKRYELARKIQYANQHHNEFEPPVRDLTRQDAAAYVAGLIDSEGSLKINKSTRSLQPKVEISNTNVRLMKWVNEFFVGRMYLKQYENVRHTDLHTWVLYDKKEIERFLLSILPYLVLKKEHANLVLQAVRCPNSERFSLYERLRDIQNTRTPTTNMPSAS